MKNKLNLALFILLSHYGIAQSNSLSTVQIEIDRSISDFDKLASKKSDSTAAFGLSIYKLIQKEINLTSTKELKQSLALISDKLGDHYRATNQVEDAINYYSESIRIKEILGEKGRPYIYTKVSDVYYWNNKYALSMKSALKALELSDEIKRKTKGEIVVMLIANNLLGNSYSVISDWENSLFYYKEGLKAAKKSRSVHGEAMLWHSIGSVYRKTGQHEVALENYKKSLMILSEREEMIQKQSGNIARMYCNISTSFLHLDKIDSSEVYIQKAYSIADINDGGFPALDILFAQASIALEKSQYVQAKQYALRALDFMKRQKPIDVIKIYEILVKIYDHEGNTSETLKYSQLFQSFQDSVINIERQKEIIAMNTKIELKKLDVKNSIALKDKQQEISTIKKDFTNRRLMLFLWFGLALLGGGLFFNIRYRKRKKFTEANQQNAEDQIKEQLKRINLLQSKMNSKLVESSNFDAEIINKNLGEIMHTKLTKRELEVLVELCKGKDNKKIASDLFVSVNTIRTHLLKIYDKMDVKNRTQAVKKAENLSKE